MDPSAVLQVLLDANRLKRTPRTGWVMRGVANAESVADHSFGTAITAMILAELADQPLDKAKVLTIALLHDLPESLISDLPTPAVARLPPGGKRSAEAAALGELLLELPCAEQWQAWWREFEDGTSAEGRLVRDADRLDLLIQAHVYERTTGNRWLSEFWRSADEAFFESPAARAIYGELDGLRRREG